MIFYILVVLLFLVLFLYYTQKNGLKIPSGLKDIPLEKGLPILGVLNKVEDPMCNYFVKLSKKLGPIYRIKLGMRDIVVLNDYEHIKAALVDNGEALSGRWKALKYLFIANNSGLVFTEGEFWSKQKQFVSKTLKEFGMGRSRSAEIVQDECVHLLNDLQVLKGSCVDFPRFMSLYTVNVIMKIAINKRYDHDDPEFQILEKIVNSFTNETDLITILCLICPSLENHDWLMKFIMWVSNRKFSVDQCHDIIRNDMKEHLDQLNLGSEGNDLLDRLLITQHQLQETTGNIGSFTNWQIIRNIIEILVAGYETTSFTLVWGFMFMSMYPDVQDKVHQEIMDKVGSERLPTMGDKVSLNYTQAVIDEVLRLSCVVPLGILHRTLNDVCVKGYFIPKDTVVIPNIFASHLDSNVWERPMEFYPEHFLTKDINDTMKYKPRAELIPFSMGKRQCLGESLARMEVFIFFTSILQRFQLCHSKDVPEKQFFDVFASKSGIVRTPKTKNFIFKSRR